jgi:hypothetical protein
MELEERLGQKETGVDWLFINCLCWTCQSVVVLIFIRMGVVLSLKRSKPLPKRVKTRVRSKLGRRNRLGRFSCTSEVENLLKIVINSFRFQTRRSIYIFQSTWREKWNSAIHSSIWGSWKIQLGQFWEPATPISARPTPWKVVFFVRAPNEVCFLPSWR